MNNVSNTERVVYLLAALFFAAVATAMLLVAHGLEKDFGAWTVYAAGPALLFLIAALFMFACLQRSGRS